MKRNSGRLQLFGIIILFVQLSGCASNGPKNEAALLPYEIHWTTQDRLSGTAEGYVIDRAGVVSHWREMEAGNRESHPRGRLSQQQCNAIRSTVQACDYFGAHFGGNGEILTRISVVRGKKAKSVSWIGVPANCPAPLRNLVMRLEDVKTMVTR